MLKLACTLLLLLISFPVYGVEDGSGLEAPSGSKVYVIVERVSIEAEQLGLTKEFIKSKAELQLHRNGIPIGSLEESHQAGFYLDVNVHVTKYSFSINLSLNRNVYYYVGDKIYSTLGTTYKWSGTGNHGLKWETVIQGLNERIDAFSIDFIRDSNL